VVGGDGSVHEVVNGLVSAGRTGVELALLPQGTGKDVARSLRIPRDLEAALVTARDGVGRSFDVGAADFTAPGGPARAYFQIGRAHV